MFHHVSNIHAICLFTHNHCSIFNNTWSMFSMIQLHSFSHELSQGAPCNKFATIMEHVWHTFKETTCAIQNISNSRAVKSQPFFPRPSTSMSMRFHSNQAIVITVGSPTLTWNHVCVFSGDAKWEQENLYQSHHHTHGIWVPNYPAVGAQQPSLRVPWLGIIGSCWMLIHNLQLSLSMIAHVWLQLHVQPHRKHLWDLLWHSLTQEIPRPRVSCWLEPSDNNLDCQINMHYVNMQFVMTTFNFLGPVQESWQL